jgi:hypothetical protein
MGGGLLAAIASLAAPITARILLALGFTVVTLGGVAGIVAELKSRLIGYLGGVPLAGLQIAGLAGIWNAMGMMLGAVTFTVTLWTLTKAVRIAGTS